MTTNTSSPTQQSALDTAVGKLEQLVEQAKSGDDQQRADALSQFAELAEREDWSMLKDVIADSSRSMLKVDMANAPVEVLRAIFMQLTKDKPEALSSFLLASLQDALVGYDHEHRTTSAEQHDPVDLWCQQLAQQLARSNPASADHREHLELQNTLLKHAWVGLSGSSVKKIYMSAEQIFGDGSADSPNWPETIRDYLKDSVGYLWRLRARSGDQYTTAEIAWLRGAFALFVEHDTDWAQLMNEDYQLRSLHLRDSDDIVATLQSAVPDLLRDKAKRTEVASRLSLVAPATIDRAGLLKDKRKKIRAMVLEGLLASIYAESADYLQTLLDDKACSPNDQSTIRARLRQLGVVTEPASESEAPGAESAAVDAPSLGAIRDMAKQDKSKPSKYIDRIWDAAYPAWLAPLDEPLIRWLLNLAHTGGDTLSAPILQALDTVDPVKRTQFAVRLVEKWAENNVHASLKWVLLFVAQYPAAELSDMLGKCISTLAWDRREPTLVALDALGAAADSTALTWIDEVASGYFPAKHKRKAKGLLIAAAFKRGLSLGELLESALPGAEMSLVDGEVLSLGSREVTLRVSPALELRVVQDNGKLAKSIPRKRKEDDPALHQSARSRVEIVKKRFKTIEKRLATRLQSMFLCGRQWNCSEWRAWLSANPLLAIAGQRVIWAQLNEVGQLQNAFRISEDCSLTNVNDDAVQLSDGDHISIWHQRLDEPQSVEQWRAHFLDYELEPLLSQLDGTAVLDIELSGNEKYQGLAGKQVPTKQFKSWAKTNGYYNEPGMEPVYHHFLLLPYLGKAVVVEHDEYGYFEDYGYSEDDEFQLVGAFCIHVDLPQMAAGNGTWGKSVSWDELPEITRALVADQLFRLRQIVST